MVRPICARSRRALIAACAVMKRARRSSLDRLGDRDPGSAFAAAPSTGE